VQAARHRQHKGLAPTAVGPARPTKLQRWLAEVNPCGEEALVEYAAAYARGEVLLRFDDRPSQRGATNEDDNPVLRAVRPKKVLRPAYPNVETAKNHIFQSAVSQGVPRSFYYSQGPETRARIWDNCWGAAEQVLRGLWPPTKACLVSRIKTRMVACIRDQMHFYQYYRVRNPQIVTVDAARITGDGRVLGPDRRDDYTGSLRSVHANDVPSRDAFALSAASASDMLDGADHLNGTHEDCSPFGRGSLERIEERRAAEQAQEQRERDRIREWQDKQPQRLLTFATEWPHPWDDGSLEGQYLCARCAMAFLPFDKASVYCSAPCQAQDESLRITRPPSPITVVESVATPSPAASARYKRERDEQEAASKRAASQSEKYRAMFDRLFRSSEHPAAERNWSAFEDWLRGGERRPARLPFASPAEIRFVSGNAPWEPQPTAEPGPERRLDAMAVAKLSPEDRHIWDHRNDRYGSVAALAGIRPGMGAAERKRKRDAYWKRRSRVRARVERSKRQLARESDLLRDRPA